ncbi:hypothetical protein EDEG_01777, partial [Edhazardia aedis USNM 41457]
MVVRQLTTDDTWQILSTYFNSKGLLSQQLDSFNSFVGTTLQEIVDENKEIRIKTSNEHLATEIFNLTFNQIYAKIPPSIVETDGQVRSVTPSEVRLRDLTYMCPLYIDISVKKGRISAQRNTPLFSSTIDDDGVLYDQHSYSKVPIGSIPIMVRSSHCATAKLDSGSVATYGECPYDYGGYFIVNGSEKVLISQERMSTNHVHVYSKNDVYFAEIRSAQEKGSKMSKPFYVKKIGKILVCNLPYIKGDIPVVILFRALGFISDKDILSHILYDDKHLEGENVVIDDYTTDVHSILGACIEDSFAIQDKEMARDYIGKRGAPAGSPRAKRIQFATSILEKEFLPHIGTTDFLESRKAYFLGYMINRLLLVSLGKREIDDRDHYGKKRLDMCGSLLSGLFRTLFRKLVNETQKHMQKCIENGRDFNIALGLKTSILTNGFRYALATGNWGEQSKTMQSKAGVAQVLNRFNYISTLSHLRRVNTPIGRDGKLAKPRQLHNTHWGMVCPAETPEGQACGLVKNLSLLCYISVGSNSAKISEYLDEWGVVNLEMLENSKYSKKYTKVFVNGVWQGVCDNAKAIVEGLNILKRTGEIIQEVSIVWDIRENEIRILTDAGRPCRPLFVVENDEVRVDNTLSFDDLVAEGRIEYLDVEEEETSMICMSLEELHNKKNNNNNNSSSSSNNISSNDISSNHISSNNNILNSNNGSSNDISSNNISSNHISNLNSNNNNILNSNNIS